jgi:hypothetical protein
MKKIALILAGYGLAVLMAMAAVKINSSFIPADQASGGMAAFGDLVLFLGVFGLAALPVTGAGMYILRERRRLWALLPAAAAAAFAAGFCLLSFL